jgi:SulP family sulfate permease
VTLGAILFMHRMAELVEVRTHQKILDTDEGDDDAFGQTDSDVVIYRIAGPFFFGAASAVSSVLEQIGQRPRAYILDLSAVPLADATGAQALLSFAQKARRLGSRVFIAGAERNVLRALLQSGLNRHDVTYMSSVAAAQERVAQMKDQPA